MVSPNPDYSRTPPSIEAQDHLLRAVERLRDVGKDGEVRITIGGKPVARLLPIDESNGAASIAQAVEFIEQFGQRHTLAGHDWKMLRDEGRR